MALKEKRMVPLAESLVPKMVPDRVAWISNASLEESLWNTMILWWLRWEFPIFPAIFWWRNAAFMHQIRCWKFGVSVGETKSELSDVVLAVPMSHESKPLDVLPSSSHVIRKPSSHMFTLDSCRYHYIYILIYHKPSLALVVANFAKCCVPAVGFRSWNMPPRCRERIPRC